MMAIVYASLGIVFSVDLYFWFHVVFCLRVLYPNACWWQCSPSICSTWTVGYPFILLLTNLKCSGGRYFFIHRESLDFTPNSNHELGAVIKDSILPILILHSSVIYSLFSLFLFCCPVCKHLLHLFSRRHGRRRYSPWKHHSVLSVVQYKPPSNTEYCISLTNFFQAFLERLIFPTQLLKVALRYPSYYPHFHLFLAHTLFLLARDFFSSINENL